MSKTVLYHCIYTQTILYFLSLFKKQYKKNNILN